ncbi:PP2C family protein-serine/threonine phosphatase [Streptomyces zingiberis]|uniref:SpoIIE family protein phosphatase n=1 Tax=Streptomyces zingiberis TaxID=2053010 RepID=A0ABX1BVV4_9ACTN|nr:PP2C family protein-serine/threonine phosphatase [Streptomyces zingiberis]NJQ00393.1 SpoIIE family protein phosphatase [Streptomyces zingiberis]
MSLGLFRAITKLLPHPVLLVTADGRLLAANAAAVRLMPELRPDADLFALAEGNAESLRGHLGHWLRSGDPLPGSLRIKDSRGGPLRFRCHGARATWWTGPEPVIQLHLTRLDHTDEFVALSQQVIALNKEMAFRRAAEAEREHLLVAEQAGRIRLNHLYRLTAALAAAATPAAVVRAVHDTAPAALGARSVRLSLHSERLVPSLGPAEGLPSPTGGSWTDLDRGPRPPAQGGPATVERIGGAPGEGAPAGHPGEDGEDGENGQPGEAGRPALRLPLEADGLFLGELGLEPAAEEMPDDAHITAVTQQIAQALRRAGLHEHEHRLAERLQRSLLPVLPEIDGLELAGRYAPGSDLVDVGGDWYDVHLLDEEHIGLSIGDVAGHGLSEATAMGQISAALRGIVLRHGRRPAAVLAELDHFLRAYHPHRMATACYLVLHRTSGAVCYSRAGHLPPLLVHVDGGSSFLDGALAPPLGMVHGVTYTESRTRVGAGETLLLYTDGLVERRGEILDVGLERLTELAMRTAGLPADQLCEMFLHHQPTADKPDDCALLALRLTAREN